MGGGDPLETCRNIPLDRVAAALGYRKDPDDRARFRREGSVISINGEKFFDHLRGTGGGGAIDLVIHATGCRFPDALRFLGGHEARGKASAIPAAPRRLRLPGPSPGAWPRVTESAVDAISARSLRIEGTRENGAVVASTAGIASAVPTWIEDWKPKRVICAYDADSAGDAAADRLAINDPRVIRLRPKGAKDWNEILLRLQ